MFRSTDFVVKHVKNKHEEKLANLNNKHFRSKARDNLVTEIEKNKEAHDAAMSAANADRNTQHQNSFNSAGGNNFDGNNQNQRGGNNSFFEGRGGYNGRGDFRSGGRGGHGSFFDGDGSGHQSFHQRGGRGGRHMNSGYMGRGGGDHNQYGGHMGGNSMMDEGGNAMDFDGAKGDKRRGEYIDYDDPTQFDKDGQRIVSQTAAAAQNQLQL